MTVAVKPGDVFFDKLDDGRYERCVLQPTDDGTPNREKVARGGTGQFFEAVDFSSLPEDDSENDDDLVLIQEVVPGSFPKFVVLKPVKA